MNPPEPTPETPRESMVAVRRDDVAPPRDLLMIGGLRIAPPAAAGAPPEAAEEAAPPDPRRVAVLVCHGMGQQVPFQTLDAVGRLLAGSHREDGGGESARPQVGYARLGGRRMPRAEFRLAGAEGPRDVHVYEGYWAPLVEGEVRAWDVTRFLFGAGIAGLRYAVRGSFDRLMFGRVHPLPIPRRSFWMLLGAFLVVCAALMLYAAFALVASARILELLLIAPGAPWPGRELVLRLSIDLLGSPLGAGVPILLALSLWGLVRGEAAPGPAPSRLRDWRGLAGERPRLGAGWILALALVAGWVVASGGAIGYDVVRWCFGELTVPTSAELAASVAPRRTAWTFARSPGFLAFLLVGGVVLAKLRWFYIQYLGDVAAYVSSHTVNRFATVRDRIQAVGRDAIRAIVAERRGDGWEYDRVLVVGHSLGSVVAYDTLNWILNEDAETGGGLDVAERSLGLVTFGSPLDKTAFIFRTQLANAEIREALAAANQPLIQPASGSGCGRTLPWINLWSPRDPVSGCLEFYDPRPGCEPSGHLRVTNCPDPDAGAFGAAHNTYWNTPLLAGVLYDRVTEHQPALR